MTTTDISRPATDNVERFLSAVCGDVDHGPEWADDAVLDAVVPGWRFSLRGPERINGQLRSWFCNQGELEEVRRIPTPGGEVVELTLTWSEGGVPHAARQVHVLGLDDAGRIARDDMWCGGRWPAALLAQMAATDDAG